MESIQKKKKKEDNADKPFVNTTPAGEKKGAFIDLQIVDLHLKLDTTQPMRNAYEPNAVEASWYDWWVKKGFFTADNQSEKEKFVIVIPPPNVTGSLHLGHALTNAVEDAISRWFVQNEISCDS